MGNSVTRDDFEWTDKEEPHAKRRTEMLKRYPQIRKLFGVDPSLKWKVLCLMLAQFAMVYLLAAASWPVVVLAACTAGGGVSQVLNIALHEVTHGCAFGAQRPLANCLFGIFANLPLGIPYYVALKRYHSDHHKYMGIDGLDPDHPTELEGKFFRTSFAKFMWVFLQPLSFVITPFKVRPKARVRMEYVNLVVQVIFDILVYHYFGGKVLFYLIGGFMLGMGLNPLAGMNIGGHFMIKKGHETNSYYGPLNLIIFNFGYHNEHHDFPYVPGSRLPEVRKIAPEFYGDLPPVDSLVKVIYDFIFDPELGPFARAKRARKKDF